MTREEAIALMKRNADGYYPKMTEALDMAIKALEQEPCEDAISREQAIRATYGFERYTGIDEAPYEYTENILRDLPPVTPQSKTGQWVNGEYCSECGCDVPAYIIDWKWQKDMDAKYCPNCGIKMKGKSEE